VDCLVSTTWQRLHSHQLSRRRLACQVRHEVGPETFFKQNSFYRDVFQIFFFRGRKIKTDPNYMDDYNQADIYSCKTLVEHKPLFLPTTATHIWLHNEINNSKPKVYIFIFQFPQTLFFLSLFTPSSIQYPFPQQPIFIFQPSSPQLNKTLHSQFSKSNLSSFIFYFR